MERLDLIHNIPFYQNERYPHSKALNYKIDGKWKHVSTKEICDQVDLLASGIIKKYPNRKNIGIYASSGSPQWNIIDFAIMKSGHVCVPIHGKCN